MRLVPTVVFGLGTTGLRVLNHLRQLVYECFGVPEIPLLRLVAMESSTEGFDELERESNIPPSLLRKYPNSIIYQKERLTVNFNDFKSWPTWWNKPIQEPTLGTRGAQQYRVVGRFMYEKLYKNELSGAGTTIEKLLSTGVRDVWYRGFVRETEQRLREHQLISVVENLDVLHAGNEKVQIIFVGTLSGGTASSMFLTLPKELHRIFGTTSADNQNIYYGLFGIPFHNSTNRASVINTISSMREYEAFCSSTCFEELNDLSVFESRERDDVRHPMVEALFNSEQINRFGPLSDRFPFNYLYLRSANSDNEIEYTSHIPYEFALFCLLRFIGFQEPYENASQKKATCSTASTEGMYRQAFGAFRCSGMIFPRLRVAFGTANRNASETLENLTGNPDQEPLNAEQELIRKWLIDDLKNLGKRLRGVDSEESAKRHIVDFVSSMVEEKLGFNNAKLNLRHFKDYLGFLAEKCANLRIPREIRRLSEFTQTLGDTLIGISFNRTNMEIHRVNMLADEAEGKKAILSLKRIISEIVDNIKKEVGLLIEELDRRQADYLESYDQATKIPRLHFLKWVFIVREDGKYRFLDDDKYADNYIKCVEMVEREMSKEPQDKFVNYITSYLLSQSKLTESKPDKNLDDAFEDIFEELYSSALITLRKIGDLPELIKEHARERCRAINTSVINSIATIDPLEAHEYETHGTGPGDVEKLYALTSYFYSGGFEDNPSRYFSYPPELRIELPVLKSLIVYYDEEFQYRKDKTDHAFVDILKLLTAQDSLYQSMLRNYETAGMLTGDPRYGHIHRNPKIVTIAGWHYTFLDDVIKAIAALGETAKANEFRTKLPAEWWDTSESRFTEIREAIKSWFNALPSDNKETLRKSGESLTDYRIGALWRTIASKDASELSEKQKVQMKEYWPFQEKK